MARGRTGCYCHPDRLGELLGLLGSTQDRVYRRRSIEMGYVLVLEEMPDVWVVDLS